MRDDGYRVSVDVWEQWTVVGESWDGVDAMDWNAGVGVFESGGGERVGGIRVERLEERLRVFEQHGGFVRVGVRDVRDGERFRDRCFSIREGELRVIESVAVARRYRRHRGGDRDVHRRGVCTKRVEKRGESRARRVE